MPKYAADIYARAFLVLSLATTVTFSGISGITSPVCTTITEAPFSTAEAIYLCPLLTAPAIHTNAVPSVTFLESEVSDVTLTSTLPCITLISSFSTNSDNCILTSIPG